MPNTDRAPSVRSLMRSAIIRLQEQGIDEARLTVELLLAHALHCQRITLYTQADRQLQESELQAFDQLLTRRVQREPLQYIVGATSFMGLQFRVDHRVLIPRPETETLVEQVMIDLNGMDPALTPRVLDIGTGCGNIAVALAKFARRSTVTALEISADALEVAQLNARVHDVESILHFVLGDIFAPVRQMLTERFTHIVSNPPYESVDEWQRLQPEVRDHEPRQAVTDGSDGYRFHRRIAELAGELLTENGKVYLEVGWGQAPEVQRILTAYGAVQCSVIPDLQAVPRVVVATFQPMSRPAPSRN